MSFDLYQDETEAKVSQLGTTTDVAPSGFDGFMRSAGNETMRGFAKTGRAVSMALGAVPVVADAITGGTELQDKYFRSHDEIFGNAVDHWAPRPEEVNVAGQITGQLLSALPQLIANPAGLIASTQLSVAEDLVREGVDADKAQQVGAVQAAGLGLGIYVPILGKTLTQRVLLGGAGFNVAQGAATRGISGEILEGTPAEGQFEAFDSTSLTLDALLGAAFGGVAHLSPAQRAQSAEFIDKLTAWAKNADPSQVEALATMRQAQHLNVDSLPGKPVDASSIDDHVQRLRTAIDQLARDEPVNVTDLNKANVEPDPVRMQENEARAQYLLDEAKRIADEEEIVTVYHGTPYEFTRFDMKNVGTGEGAQAYGYGLYFAENKNISKFYAKSVSRRRADGPGVDDADSSVIKVNGKKIDVDKIEQILEKNPNDPEANAIAYLSASGGNKDDAIETLKSTAGLTNDVKEASLKFLSNADVSFSENLYEAQIRKNVYDNLLDWDKPLIEQPNVLGLLRNAFGEDRLGDLRGQTGKDLYKRMAGSDDDKNASRELNEAGIPGIRYLDRSSRVSGEGTRNVVLFDDRHVTVVAINGEKVRKDSSNKKPQSNNLDNSNNTISEAERIATERPDATVYVGTDANGEAIQKPIRKFLDDAKAETDLAKQEAKLFKVAAACMMGVA